MVTKHLILKTKKTALFSLGTISLGLAMAGAFLPVLPTTPFLLLSAFCFLKSSKAMYKKLTTHPVFGKIILDYLEHQSVSAKNKVKALLLLWLCILCSIFWVGHFYLSLLLLGIAIGVTGYLISLKTAP